MTNFINQVVTNITTNVSNFFQSSMPNYYSEITNYLSDNPLTNYYFQGLVMSFIIWLLYLELSPKLGGIFFRPDSSGNFRFRLGGVIPMLLYPFQSLDFWYPNNWDLNFIMFSQIGALIYTLLKCYQQNISS